MTSSGLYTYNLNTGGILIEAFDRIEIRPVEITREQMSSAIRSINLDLSTLNNMPVNLWCIDFIVIPAIQGTSSYPLDPKYQLVTDVFARLTQSGVDTDRILLPISRSTYASYPQKQTQGPSSVFWFERLEIPILTVWPVPDGETEDSICCYAMRRVQDIVNDGTQTVDVPYRFLEVVISRLATRLALKFKPEKYALMKSISDEIYQTAYVEDQERADLIISPIFQAYDPIG